MFIGMNKQVTCAHSKSCSFVNSTVLCSKRMLNYVDILPQRNSWLTFRDLSLGQDTALISAQMRITLHVQNFLAEMENELKGHHPIRLRNLMGNLLFSIKSSRTFPFWLYLKCWDLFAYTSFATSDTSSLLGK